MGNTMCCESESRTILLASMRQKDFSFEKKQLKVLWDSYNTDDNKHLNQDEFCKLLIDLLELDLEVKTDFAKEGIEKIEKNNPDGDTRKKAIFEVKRLVREWKIFEENTIFFINEDPEKKSLKKFFKEAAKEDDEISYDEFTAWIKGDVGKRNEAIRADFKRLIDKPIADWEVDKQVLVQHAIIRLKRTLKGQKSGLAKELAAGGDEKTPAMAKAMVAKAMKTTVTKQVPKGEEKNSN